MSRQSLLFQKKNYKVLFSFFFLIFFLGKRKRIEVAKISHRFKVGSDGEPWYMQANIKLATTGTGIVNVHVEGVHDKFWITQALFFEDTLTQEEIIVKLDVWAKTLLFCQFCECNYDVTCKCKQNKSV